MSNWPTEQKNWCPNKKEHQKLSENANNEMKTKMKNLTYSEIFLTKYKKQFYNKRTWNSKPIDLFRAEVFNIAQILA